MQDKTIVPTNLLSWPKVKNLIPDHKLIVLALWQNPFITPCGTYFIDLDMFSSMLGFNKLNVEQAICDFEEKGIVMFDSKTSEVLVSDWWRFHKCESPAQINMIQRAVDKIQSDKLKTESFERIKHVSNKINDLRSNHNRTKPNLTKTQQQPDAEASVELAAEAAAGSGGGKLIFHKAIDQSLHQQLAALLQNVEPNLAQSMLDTLAQKIIDGERNEKFKVNCALNYMAHFINVKFDGTAGITISKMRERAAAEAEKRKLDNEQKNRPRKVPSTGETSAAEFLKSKKYLDKGIDMGQNVP